jgi:hypothetical protein
MPTGPRVPDRRSARKIRKNRESGQISVKRQVAHTGIQNRNHTLPGFVEVCGVRNVIVFISFFLIAFSMMSSAQALRREPVIPKARLEATLKLFQGARVISISTAEAFNRGLAVAQAEEGGSLPPFLPPKLLEAGGVPSRSIKFVGQMTLPDNGEAVVLIGDFNAAAFVAKYSPSPEPGPSKFKAVDVPIPRKYQRKADPNDPDSEIVKTVLAFATADGMLVFVENRHFAEFSDIRKFRAGEQGADFLSLVPLVPTETEIAVFGYQEMRDWNDPDPARARVPVTRCFRFCGRRLALEEFILGADETLAAKIEKWKIGRLTTDAQDVEDAPPDPPECLGRIKEGERFAVSREGRLVQVSVTPELFRELSVGLED